MLTPITSSPKNQEEEYIITIENKKPLHIFGEEKNITMEMFDHPTRT